jgi:hypothetical protein
LTWQDDHSATAERGSKAASFAAGAAAQYFNVGVHLMTDQPEETTVRLDRQSLSGAWLKGGALSPLRVSRNLASLRTELEGDFRNAGVLRSVGQG